MSNDSVGGRIRELRTKQGITQEKLAERAGISTRHISDVECGRRNLGVDSLSKIASALSVTTEHLLRGQTQGNEYGLILPILDSFEPEELPLVETILRDILALKGEWSKRK